MQEPLTARDPSLLSNLPIRMLGVHNGQSKPRVMLMSSPPSPDRILWVSFFPQPPLVWPGQQTLQTGAITCSSSGKLLYLKAELCLYQTKFMEWKRIDGHFRVLLWGKKPGYCN